MYKAIEMSKIDNLQKIFNIHRILLMFATVSRLHGPAINLFYFLKRPKNADLCWSLCGKLVLKCFSLESFLQNHYMDEIDKTKPGFCFQTDNYFLQVVGNAIGWSQPDVLKVFFMTSPQQNKAAKKLGMKMKMD